MTQSFVNRTTGTGSGSATGTISTGGTNRLIIVNVAAVGSSSQLGTPTLAGVTFTHIAGVTNAAARQDVFAAIATPQITAQTLTVPGYMTANTSFECLEYSGVNTASVATAIDAYVTASFIPSVTTYSAGAITTGASNDLIVLCLALSATGTVSAASGYTTNGAIAGASGVYMWSETANAVTPTSGTAVTPTATSVSTLAPGSAIAISLGQAAYVPPAPNPIALPTFQFNSVGVNQILLGPRPSAASWSLASWLAGNTYTTLARPQTLDFDQQIKTAQSYGGESIWQRDEYPYEAMVNTKVTAQKIDLSAFYFTLNGDLAVQAPTGYVNQIPNEQQFFTPILAGVPQYFTLYATSIYGDKTLTIFFPKVKVSKSVTYNLDRTKLTDFVLDASANWDDQYVNYQGQIGGIYDAFFVGGGGPIQIS